MVSRLLFCYNASIQFFILYMGKIVAIGGGEIGRPGFPVETTKIDKEIIKLTGKKHPRFLFIPTASSDSKGYIRTVQKHFGQRLGCKVATLLLIQNRPSRKVIKDKIFNSDIIYVGGGNTEKMFKIWKQSGVVLILKEAYRKGIILSGVSAGAVCWFKYASSDSRRFQKSDRPFSYSRLPGINLIPLTVSPHHIREKTRKAGLIKIMKNTAGVGIALDDYSALEIVNDKFRIITSKPFANAHKVYYQGGE